MTEPECSMLQWLFLSSSAVAASSLAQIVLLGMYSVMLRRISTCFAFVPCLALVGCNVKVEFNWCSHHG